MIMARLLTKGDLAAYRQAFLAYETVTPLLAMGISQGMYYFLPTEKVRVRGRVADGMLVLAAMGVVFAIFLACGGNELLAARFTNPQVARMLLWMIPFTIITLPSNASSNVFIATNHVNLSVVFGIVRQLVIGVATILPLLIWRNVSAPFLGNISASMLMSIASFALVLRCLPNDPWMPAWSGIKELVSFTVPLALAGMVGTITRQVDKLVVSLLCPPEEFAVYSLGAIEIPLISMVTGAITSITLLEMRKSIGEGDKEKALQLFRRTAETTALIIFPALMFFMLTADSFIQLLYTDKYADSVVPFRWYLTLLPIRTVVFGSLIIALGKSQSLLFRSVTGLILNVVVSAIFVWKFGPWGAVAATVLTIYLWIVPLSMAIIAGEMNCRWREILPFASWARTSVQISPLLLIWLVCTWAIGNQLVEFVAVAVGFAAYLAWYWHGKLYSVDEIRARLAGLFDR